MFCGILGWLIIYHAKCFEDTGHWGKIWQKRLAVGLCVGLHVGSACLSTWEVQAPFSALQASLQRKYPSGLQRGLRAFSACCSEMTWEALVNSQGPRPRKLLPAAPGGKGGSACQGGQLEAGPRWVWTAALSARHPSPFSSN